MAMCNCRVLALGVLLAAFACLMTTAAATGDNDQTLKLNFFAQEYFMSGTPTTFFAVAPMAGFADSLLKQNFLGAIAVVDPAITVGADPSSTTIGRLKGISVFDNSVNPNSPDVEVMWTVAFNEASGYSKGSTISFRGLYETLQPERELSISGGTGHFRLARGWAVVTTQFLDPNTGRAVNNFTVYLQDRNAEGCNSAHPAYTTPQW